jgi:hypothetical protein
MDEKRKKHLEALLRHIEIVQGACQLLGKRLIEAGESEFGRILIANGLVHDQSKLIGIEWEYLVRDEDPEKIELAIQQHWTSNPHHPEYWGGMNQMPRIYIAEMVCDIYARSSEFGTDLRQWVKTEAAKKYNMSVQGKAYKQIKQFIDILLDDPFKPVDVTASKTKPNKASKKNGNSNGNSTG